MKTRDALKRAFAGDEEKTQDVKGDGLPIGLAENPAGVPFHCPACKYFDKENMSGEKAPCAHPDPRLHGKEVGPTECCNRYEHNGMTTLVE